MKNIKTILKKHKLLIFFIFIFILAVGIGIFFLTRPPRVTIQNYNELSSTPNSEKAKLEEFLYRFLSSHHDNVKKIDDVYIRNSSYQKNEDGGLTSENFLLDIDSLKITYQVSHTWSEKTQVPDGIIIDCPEIKASKYPDTKCVGMYNTSEEMTILAKYPLINQLPIEVNEYINNYSEYVNYKITYTTNLDELTANIIITDLSGGNYDRAIKKITNLGADPKNYQIEYKDESSQNYWPRINKY